MLIQAGRKLVLVYIIALLCVGLGTGCGFGIHKKKDDQQELQVSCNLPANQSTTLNGRWTLGPVPVGYSIADAATFNVTELASLVTAMTSWNSFFQANLGGNFYNYGNATNPFQTSTHAPVAGAVPNSIVSGGSFTGMVSLHKIQTAAEWGESSAIIAVTHALYQAASPIQVLQGAAIRFNAVNFAYTSGGTLPEVDLQTVAMHELGHVLGLNHACDPTGAGGLPTCSANPEYAATLMRPVLLDSNGKVVQHQVDSNTGIRAYCLYGQ